MMRDHTEPQAFELADEVAVLVYRVTVFAREELFSLTSQMLRAAISILFWMKNTSAFSLQPK